MKKEIAEIIADQNPDLEYTEYSGRGMFGRKTHGIIYDNLGCLLGAIVDATIENPDTMTDSDFEKIRTDNMGLSQIMY